MSVKLFIVIFFISKILMSMRLNVVETKVKIYSI